MRAELSAVVAPLVLGKSAPPGAVRSAFEAIMAGGCAEMEIASFLTALAVRGESQSDLAEAASVMRERATRIPTQRSGLLDTCGTGGDKLMTFNISTAAALVAAAAGAPVAKHGNRHASSCSGSADVLEALGVNIRLTPEQVGRCIDEIGIGFCFAPLLHQAMKHVIPVRQALGIRTIFNLLGPLSNPAGAAYQLIGSSRIATARILAGAVAALGTTRTLVVCGNDQLDEVSLWGTTTVFDVQGESISSMEWTAADLGLSPCHVEDLRIESPQQSATMIQRALSGEPGPARDMAAANAGAALLATGRASTIREGVTQALTAIETGAARRKLEELMAWTTKNA